MLSAQCHILLCSIVHSLERVGLSPADLAIIQDLNEGSTSRIVTQELRVSISGLASGRDAPLALYFSMKPLNLSSDS